MKGARVSTALLLMSGHLLSPPRGPAVPAPAGSGLGSCRQACPGAMQRATVSERGRARQGLRGQRGERKDMQVKERKRAREKGAKRREGVRDDSETIKERNQRGVEKKRERDSVRDGERGQCEPERTGSDQRHRDWDTHSLTWAGEGVQREIRAEVQSRDISKAEL